MAEQFGLNDDMLDQWGLNDAAVGQAAQTKPVIKPGQQALAVNINASPYAPKQQPITPPGLNPQDPNDLRMIQAMQGQSPYSKNELAAAQEGVDIDRGASAKVQALMSLPDSVPEKQAILGQLTGAQTRVGPKSGKLEFIDPDTQRWTVFDGSRMAANIAGTLGPAIEGTGQLGGAVAGTAAGAGAGPAGAVAGSIAGSGVGGALGKFARITAGQALGVIPKDYPVGSDVLHAGATSAAFDLGAQGIVGGLKYARYWFKGARAFTPGEAAILGDQAKQADDLIDEVQKRTGLPFNPTIGQKVANTQLGATELGKKALGYDAALSKDNSPVMQKMEALQQQNEDALSAMFNAAQDPIVRQAVVNGKQVTLSRAQAGQTVSDAMTSIYNDTLEQAQKLVKQLPENLPASESGRIMRGALSAADQDVKRTIEDPAWAKYRDATGYNPETFSSNIKLPWSDDVRSLMSSWDSRNREAIIKAIQNDNSGLKLLFKKDEDIVSPILGQDGLPIKLGTKDNQQVDLAVLDDTIKWIRSDARKALKNKQGVSYDERDLVSLEDVLSRMRNEWLQTNKPETYSLLQDAETATRNRAALFKQGMLKDLLIKEGPDGYKLGDADALYRIITTRDDTAAAQFAKLTKAYPEAQQAARQMIFALYRKAVTDPETLAPSAKAHATFMRDYGNVIKQFFDPADYDTLRKIGGMGTVLADTQKSLREVLPRIKTVMGGLEVVNPAELGAKTLRGSYGPEQIKTATRLLQKLPGDMGQNAIEEWRSTVLDQVAKNVIDPTTGMVKINQLAKYIDGPQTATLKALLNAGANPRAATYFRDLQTVMDAANMIRSQGVGKMEDQSRGLVVKLARLVFGQFTPEARVVTFGQGMRTRQVPGQIYNAITDPEELSKLASQARVTMKQIQTANFMGALGNTLVTNGSNY